MRSQVFKSGSVAYVLASLVAILWLSVSVAHARSFRETTFATQVALLGNTLLGAAQNLDAISTQGDDGRGDDTVRLLVNAEASLAQAEIVAIGV